MTIWYLSGTNIPNRTNPLHLDATHAHHVFIPDVSGREADEVEVEARPRGGRVAAAAVAVVGAAGYRPTERAI